MTNSKSTKKALFSSAVALFLCFTMLLGTTYAWFTDSVSAGLNKIQSGNLDIALYHIDYTSGDYSDPNAFEPVGENTPLFLNVDGKPILWEPGAGAEEDFRIVNEGSLALKYRFMVTYANATETPDGKTLADILDVTMYQIGGTFTDDQFKNPVDGTVISPENNGLDDGVVVEGYLLPGEDIRFLTTINWYPSDNDNDFNVPGGLSLDLGITLLATQYTYEKDDIDDQYDKDASLDDVMIEKKLELTDDSTEAIEIGEKESLALNMGGNTLANTLTNNGKLNASDGDINTPNTATGAAAVALANYGNATLTDVDMVAGSSSDYANILYANSVTVYDNVNVVSRGGGIGVTNGATAMFNSGSVYIDSASTSGRYIFYLAGAGSELTINGGEFSWDPADNQKRAYVFASAGTTVNITGGEFGKASTRSGYTDGILGDGTVIITGGTFGFNPTKWVAEGYVATESNGTWTVSAAN